MRTVLIALFLSGCSGWEVIPPSAAESSDPSLASNRTLHFLIQGRDYALLKRVGEICEEIYKKIMFDTNLLSFKPRENYRITLYPTRLAYEAATGYPAWSGGGTSTELFGQTLPEEREERARTSISTFVDQASAPLFAHELSHLIFNEFMRFSSPEMTRRVLWLNEGFATFQELEASDPQDRELFRANARSLLRKKSYTLDELVSFRPFNAVSENVGSVILQGRTVSVTNINLWYWQSEELVNFLIREGGQYPFYILLNAFRRGKETKDAFQEAYTGRWRNLSELEAEWKQTL